MLTMCEEDYYAEDRCATYGEAFKEYAYNAGSETPEQEWILTPWDTWEVNPHYTGPKGRHPEDDHYEEEGCEAPGFDSPREDWAAKGPAELDDMDGDFIPF